MHYRVTQPFGSFNEGESFTGEQRDGLASFLMFNVLEAKIFRDDFLEGHNVRENNSY